jgi:dCTP deaminase
VFLSADEIREEVESGRLVIDPFEPKLLKTFSYVLRMGDRYRQWRPSDEFIDAWSSEAGRNQLGPITEKAEIILRPGVFVLAATLEKVSMPSNLVGILSNLSHLARLGVSVHQNAFWVSSGYGGCIPTQFTLELASFNPSPVKIRSGIPACHLIIARTSRAAQSVLKLHKSVYEGLEAPAAPLLFEEFQNILFTHE